MLNIFGLPIKREAEAESVESSSSSCSNIVVIFDDEYHPGHENCHIRSNYKPIYIGYTLQTQAKKN